MQNCEYGHTIPRNAYVFFDGDRAYCEKHFGDIFQTRQEKKLHGKICKRCFLEMSLDGKCDCES